MQKTQGYIWKYAKQYYLLIIVGFIFLISAKVAATAEPVFLRNIINGLTAHNPLSAILAILSIYFLLKLGEAISEFLRDWILAPVIIGISRDFEKSVFQKLLTLPVSYHADQKTGAAARSVTRGSQAVSFILDFSVSQFLPPFFELIFVSALLFKLYS